MINLGLRPARAQCRCAVSGRRRVPRIAIAHGLRQLDLIEQRHHAAVEFHAAEAEIKGKRASKDRLDGLARVERKIGDLADNLDVTQDLPSA